MKIKVIAILTCVLMLFSLPSYGATKKKVVVKPKPPLEFNFILPPLPDLSNLGEIDETCIVLNSIGTPELKLAVVNTSKKPVIAFEFQTSFIDTFGRPVYRLGSKTRTFTGIVQKTWIAPEKTINSSKNGKLYTFNLALYKLADSITMDKYQNQVVTLTRVKFNDGTVWKK